MKPHLLFVLGLIGAGASLLAAEGSVTERAMHLAREAADASTAGDAATYLSKMEQAVALRPDFPRMLVNLAAAQIANNRVDDALATLDRLAALGLTSPVDKSAEFAAVRELPAFKSAMKKLSANARPQGDGYTAFAVRDVTGLLEGIAWREKTGEYYFGDVNGRAVWVRNPKDGALRRLTPEGDALFGVFGLAIDEGSGTLWAATSAVPAMRGFTPEQDGTAALAEIELESGAVRRTIPVVRRPGDQQSHVLGDLVIAGDGTIYLPDSGGPTIWRLAPGGAALEAFVESEEFMSLQGVVVSADGAALVVSDHANGFLRVDLATRQVRRLEPPAGATLVGTDGLTLAGNGDIIAIQNGVRPPRVLRVALEGAADSIVSVTVLESAHLTMPAPALGCIAEAGDFYFIGNAGWTRFENTDARPTPPRPVPIFRTKLKGATPKKK